MQQKMLVSVVMITYGHEKYIREAIEGVLMQEGDFDLELIIANDCSPDNSDFIIQSIIKENKTGVIIKYFKHEINKGIMPNFYFALNKCKGEFIAICEGDDYWIDPNKIEKQLKVFQLDLGIGLVYTGVRKLFQESGNFIDEISRTSSVENQVPSMLESKFIEFATVLFRNDLLLSIAESLKKEMYYKIIGDTRILLEAAHRTKIGYIEDVTTVYRINQGSATQSLDTKKYIFAILDTYQCRKNFVFRYNYPKKYLSISLANTFKNLVNKSYSEIKYSDRIKILKQIPYKDILLYVNFRDFIKKNSYKQLLKFIFILIGFKNVS